MIYLISDLHIGHKNIIEYEKDTRPFETLEEHDQAIVDNWNSVVSDEDDVWVVGDFIMGSPDNVTKYLPMLHGRIHLVRGNHDTANKIALYEEYGIDVHDIAYLEYKNKMFILCHFPIVIDEFAKMVCGKNLAKYVYCYGHVHSNTRAGYYNGTFHVGVDTNNLMPVSIDDIFIASLGEESVF